MNPCGATLPCPRTRGALLLCALLGLLGGCAHTHVDADGRRHVVGLVWLTLPPIDVQPVGADSVRLRTLGLTLSLSPAGSGATVGYADTTITVVRNDAMVSLPTLNAREGEGARP